MNYKFYYTFAMAIALGLITLPTASFAAVDRKKSEEFFEDAIDQIRATDLSAAIIQLRNALQQNPQNLPARIQLGKVLMQEDQPLAAIKELETALSMGGDENLILIPLAKAYLTIAKPEQVITNITSTGHEPQVDGELKLLQGNSYLQLGSEKEAENLFAESSVLLQTDPRPLLGLAKIHLAKGRSKPAMKLLDQATGLAPDSFDVWVFKAIMHRDHGQYRQAIPAFERAIELFPGSVRALTARAAMWMDLGQLERAQADIDSASEFNRDSLETIYLRSVLLFSNGKSDEAREVLRAGAAQIALTKESYRAKLPNTILMLGVVAFFDENYDEAITNLKLFSNKFPNHPGARRYLASAYLAKREWENIIKLIRPVRGSGITRDPFLLSILAEAYRGLGNFNEAERYYSIAEELAPHVAGIALRLAASQIDAGNPEKAIAGLMQLIEKFPDLYEAKAHLARFYLKTGDTELASQTATTLRDEFPDQANAHIVFGVVQMARRDFAVARESFELAALMAPDLLQPKLNLARIAKLEGHRESAEALYRVVLEKFPSNPTAQIELCELLLETGFADEANERINTLVGSNPKNVQAQILRIRILLEGGATIEKIRDTLSEFSTKFENNPIVAIAVGRGYVALGQNADAKVHFRRAAESAEFDTDALLKTANQQFLIGDYSGALWSLTKAQQASPRNLQVSVLRAGVLSQSGDFERAREEIDSAIEQHGERAEVRLVEGDLFMKQEMVAEALDAYKAAWQLKPAKKTTHVLIRAYIKANQFDEAEGLALNWISSHPDDYIAKTLLAEKYMFREEWLEALSAYEQLQSDGIENVMTLNNLAVIYQRLGDPRALSAAEAAYNLAPENATVLDTYGWVLTENGQTEKGLAILRDAYARVSTHPEIRYHIGVALAKLGREDEAMEEVKAALQDDASFVDKDAATDLLRQLETN